MFDFWDIAGKALQGGLKAFLGGNKQSSVTDNSSFSTSQSSSNKVTPGKAKAASITEGTPQYNQGGGMQGGPKWESNFMWNGKHFNSQLKDFLDNYEETDDEKDMK